jgi:uncharacterized DUF497 family protein
MKFEFEPEKSEANKAKHGIDFPVWMIQSLDREAKRLGVPRQSVIKVWIADRLEHAHA